jgi:hypothetical protein
MSIIIKFWNGEITLWKSYWISQLLYIPLGLTLGFLSVELDLPNLVFEIVFILYAYLVLVGVWRSSKKYQGDEINSVLARISVVLGFLYLLLEPFGFWNLVNLF